MAINSAAVVDIVDALHSSGRVDDAQLIRDLLELAKRQTDEKAAQAARIAELTEHLRLIACELSCLRAGIMTGDIETVAIAVCNMDTHLTDCGYPTDDAEPTPEQLKQADTVINKLKSRNAELEAEVSRLRDVARAAEQGTQSQVIRVEYLSQLPAVLVTMADAEPEDRLATMAAEALALLLNMAEALSDQKRIAELEAQVAKLQAVVRLAIIERAEWPAKCWLEGNRLALADAIDELPQPLLAALEPAQEVQE